MSTVEWLLLGILVVLIVDVVLTHFVRRDG